MKRVVVVLLAFVVQAVAAAGAVESWVSAGNIAPPESGCGYDGTCAGVGVGGALALCLVLTPVLELLVAWIWAGVQLQRAPNGSGALRFSSLVGHRVLVAATVGCLCWLVLFAQTGLLTHLAASRSLAECPAASTTCSADQIEARLLLSWTNLAVAADLAVVALVIGAIVGARLAAWRRTGSAAGT